jgi:hypothetical protein
MKPRPSNVSTRHSFRALGISALIACSLTVALVAQGRQAAPPRPAPPAAGGANPEIVVGGIQVAKVIVSADDFSAKPFNSDNGTKLVLWIKMPAGQGLIEIDEDASLLQVFGDDKATDLGGKFGSFPEEFKDGTGGTIDITSSAVPAGRRHGADRRRHGDDERRDRHAPREGAERQHRQRQEVHGRYHIDDDR